MFGFCDYLGFKIPQFDFVIFCCEAGLLLDILMASFSLFLSVSTHTQIKGTFQQQLDFRVTTYYYPPLPLCVHARISINVYVCANVCAHSLEAAPSLFLPSPHTVTSRLVKHSDLWISDVLFQVRQECYPFGNQSSAHRDAVFTPPTSSYATHTHTHTGVHAHT